MKTKQEIKEEIIELYGATQALSDAIEILHEQRMQKSKQMIAMNQIAPKKEWVGLTDEEIKNSLRGHNTQVEFARALEAKLKEKNT